MVAAFTCVPLIFLIYRFTVALHILNDTSPRIIPSMELVLLFLHC